MDDKRIICLKIVDQMNGSFTLKDGSHIAVVGGGPSGAFFSIFALKMARMVGREIRITIFEQKDFTKEGPSGCNRCGGVISELLLQMLAVEGINLPDTVVQRGINSYHLHTNYGKVYIETPTHEKTIATVYRGGGPKGDTHGDRQSFDRFLLDSAIKEGAVFQRARISRIGKVQERPVLYAGKEELSDADLVIGAVGVKSQTAALFEEIGFGYEKPETVTAAIAEIGMDREVIQKRFGTSVQLFLLPTRQIKFAAMIPKVTYVTVCILGKDMNARNVDEFMAHPVVREVLDGTFEYEIHCRCLPKMNVRAPRHPFTDRVVMCGDAGSTRLFKDGLGAAYLMGKAAAKTAVFRGVDKNAFVKDYLPVYTGIMRDNRYGRVLFAATDLLKRSHLLTESMLRVVVKEQSSEDYPKRLSSILWDMFTGNERYKNIFRRAFSIPMHMDLMSALGQVVAGRAS